VIREGFQLIYSMNLHLPTRFLILDRAIATLGSVGAELYPDFNVFEVARPYARDLMLERFTPERVARRARREAFRYAQVILEAPHQFHDFMEEIRDGQIEVGFVHKGLDDFLDQLQKVFNRLVIALVVTGGLNRLEPDRDLCQGRAAPARREHHLDPRLRVVCGARDLAPLGRRPLRTAVDGSSRFSAEGHLAEQARCT